MASPVLGNKVLLYATTDSGDTIFACARSCTFQANLSLKSVTNYQSDYNEEYKPDMKSWQMGVEGITILDNFSYATMLAYQKNRQAVYVKFSVDNGTDGFFVYQGYSFITSIAISAPFDGVSTYTAQLQGTGPYTVTGTQPNPNVSAVNQYEYTATGGETAITIPTLIGTTLLYLSKGGIDVGRILLGGSPTGNDIVFNTVTGSISFDPTNPLAPGEFLRALYK